ncbi:MAG: aminotransferase class I/II-fold pyridoxal phosphate-dependent enzyme, partial [Desulfobacteraceae bacterium]|nr:aminotransferase class I/II-fold pyridoxal phosphate-dependent enzyme [Desulfobacteraceae bacterium]
MQFIDLKAQYIQLKENIDKRIKTVLDHQRFIMGPEVQELEEKLSSYVGVKHCIGVASGTDALQISMMALGIKPGDEVITTPFSFIATAETIILLGAKPVFVDILKENYTIDPNDLKKKITKKS